MTLVEIIVATMISLLVITITGSFLIFGTNFLTKTEISSEDKLMAEDAADYAKYRMLYASSIQVVRAEEPPWVDGGHTSGDILYIGNPDDSKEITNIGRLYFMRGGDSAPIDVLGDQRYGGSGLALSYRATVSDGSASGSTNPAASRTPEKSFTLTLSTVRGNQVVYDCEKTFSLYDVGANSEPVMSQEITSWSSDSSFDPDKGKFYLLISPAAVGYVGSNLVASFDAIDNALDASGEPWHDPKAATWADLSGNGNDMKLTFTAEDSANKGGIRPQSVYFDGNGDYGMISKIDFSQYDRVTFEICFRDPAVKDAMLFEYCKENATNGWNADGGTFGLASNSNGFGPSVNEFHWVARIGNTSADSSLSARNFVSNNRDIRYFSTFSSVMSNTNDPTGRLQYVDGTPVTYQISSHPSLGHGFPVTTATVQGAGFGSISNTYKLFIASRQGKAEFFQGEIAAIRIYTGKLTPEQIEQNAAADKARFG
jgi:hypothetical protein